MKPPINYNFRVSPSPVLISTIVVMGNIILWMVMLAAIGLGAMHLEYCPLQPRIPIYLIVLGTVNLIALTLTYARHIWEDTCASNSTYVASVYFFTFCWVIAGSIWIYPLYASKHTPGGHYCHKTTYDFAFAVTTLMWIAIFIAGSFFCALTFCKNVSARGILRPHTSYGTISEEPAFGDV